MKRRREIISMQGEPEVGEAKQAIIGRTSMLNERAGQFHKAVHCKMTRQLKTEDDLALKQKFFQVS